MSKTTRPLSSKSTSKQLISEEEVVMAKTTNYGRKDRGNDRIDVLERKIKVDSKNHENEKEKIIIEKDRDICSLEAKNECLLNELDMKTEKIRQLDLSNKKKDNQLEKNHYYTETLKKEYEFLKKRADNLEKEIEEKCRQQAEIVQSNDENKVSMEAQIRSLKKELDEVRAEKEEQEKKMEQMQLDAKERDRKWKERMERQEEKTVEKEKDQKWEERMKRQEENAIEKEKEKDKKWEERMKRQEENAAEKEKEKDKKWEERMKRQAENAVEKEKEKEKKWEEKEKEKEKKWEERMKRQEEYTDHKWEERMRQREMLWEKTMERVIAEANNGKVLKTPSTSTREFQNNTETVVPSHQKEVNFSGSQNVQVGSNHYYGRQFFRRPMGSNPKVKVQPQTQFIKLPTDVRSPQNRRVNYVSSKLPSYKK